MQIQYLKYFLFKFMGSFRQVRGAGQFLSRYLGLLISKAAVMLCPCILIGPANIAFPPLILLCMHLNYATSFLQLLSFVLSQLSCLSTPPPPLTCCNRISGPYKPVCSSLGVLLVH